MEMEGGFSLARCKMRHGADNFKATEGSCTCDCHACSSAESLQNSVHLYEVAYMSADYFHALEKCTAVQ